MLRYICILLFLGFAFPATADEDISDVKIEDVDITSDDASVKPNYSPADGLREALEKAYLNNPSLKAQQKSFQATVEQVPQALSGALPIASAGYSKGRQRTQSTGTNWAHTNSELKSLTVTQPIFRGGTTYANTKSARRNVDAALARLKQIEQSVLLQAVTAYMDVVRADAVLGLSKKNRDVLASQLEAANQRFEVGEDTRTDVAQSEARLAIAESNVINSKGQLQASKAVYQEIIGDLPSNFEMPKNVPEITFSSEQLVELALKTSPILAEANALKESADYVVDANIGTLLPSVDLEGLMSRQEGTGIFGTTDYDQDKILLSANLPIYAGGQRYSRVRQAKETYQQRRFELLDANNSVRRNAISAWEKWNSAKASIESNKLAVEAAEIALDGVKQEQQYGSRTTLDVLDAERELFNAKVKLVGAERDKVVAAYSVLAVPGELTAKNMGLDVTLYDAEGYYDDTEYQFIGF